MAQLKDTQINGNLNVTEDIQIGDTSLSDVIFEKKQTSIAWSNMTAHFVRCGNVCTMSITKMQNLSANSNTNAGTIPEDYRPAINILSTVITPEQVPVRITILESGSVGIYNYSSNTGTLNVGNCITYVCK